MRRLRATSGFFARCAHVNTPYDSEPFLEVSIVKLSTSTSELLAQLQTVSRVASTRSAVQALSGVQIAAGAAARPTVDEIQEKTAEAFGITRDELLSQSRRPALAWPRQVAMYLAREHTGETLPAIGARFGGRNHTTVLHACRRTAERMATDPEAFDAVRRLTDALRAPGDDRRA